MRASRIVGTAIVLGAVWVSAASAANRFYIPDKTLGLGSSGQTVPLLADVDQDAYAFSVSLSFDAAKIRVTGVQLGSALAGLAPEYSEGKISNSPGSVVHGVVFDLSDPITKKLAAGTGRELLVLTVDVVAAAASTTQVQFVDQQGPPARVNVLTDSQGRSVKPALASGTLTLSSVSPKIESLLQNEGEAGKVFLVVGKNFDAAGLRVTVCGKSAQFEFRGVDRETLFVTAPACGTLGWSPVTVCTDFGCATETNGFLYTQPAGTTFIRGDANADGRVDLSDAISILNSLFLGIPSLAPCADASDVNDEGRVDISDGIYLLSYLFQGGDAIPPPYPNPGVDPTPDSLPDC